MKITDTISVNPSKNTLGHIDTPSASVFRSQVLDVEATHNPINLTKVLFPSTTAGLAEYNKYSVPLRTLFATILLVTGITMLTASPAQGIGFAICSICFGGALAFGFLTRPIMAGASVFYFITGAIGLRHGITDISVFSLMFGSLIFAALGAGKYSCDNLLRMAISRIKRRNEIKARMNRAGYKAFHLRK
ncbi:MAG: hypothetical protein J1F16_09455 [Muribaculaceae bacterium]|nr:hypothetical protein [Muribaculaceae bacterium]